MGSGGFGGRITEVDVTQVRALLRRSDALSRREAVDLLHEWHGRPLTDDAAAAVLRAATVGVPWVGSVPDDVGDLLTALLWKDPLQVELGEVERAYSLCGDRARRNLLRLVALRCDEPAVDLLMVLLGLDGPWDLLPLPTGDPLTPIVEAPGAERLATRLVDVAWRRGWTPHVAGLLGEMVLRGLLDDTTSAQVAHGLAPLVTELVDTCDRATITSSGRGDPSRVERRRLEALLPLYGHLDGEVPDLVLRRALSCADARVAAAAALVLARRGVAVPEERISLLARDAEARHVLVEGFGALGRHFAVPAEHLEERSVAEAALVKWLASEAQLGSAPDEVEYRGAVVCPPEWGIGRVHVLAFRIRPPHWSAQRGWMLGAVGPFDPAAEFAPRQAAGFAAYSLYLAEDDDTVEGHVLAVSEALVHLRRGEPA